MQPKPTYAIAALLFTSALLAGCVTYTPTPTVPPPTPTESPRAFELTVLHTNDVRGFIEPCG